MFKQNQEKILKEIKKNRYISQQELSELTGLSRSSVANLISDLINRGFIVGRAYIVNEGYSQKVVCIGGANVDVKSVLTKPYALHTSNPVTSSFSWGGVVRNVAENLARLGIDVGLLTVVGDEAFGLELLEQMRKIMDVAQIEKLGGQSTGKYHAILDERGDLVIGLADMDIMEYINVEWINRKINYLKRYDYWVVDTNLSKSVLSHLFDLSQQFNKKIVLVGVSVPKMERIPDNVENVYLAIFNKDESLARFKLDNAESQMLVEKWLKQLVKNVVVTDQTNPIVYGNEQGIFSMNVQKVKNVEDVTGAGDSFSAGVLYAICQKLPLEQAIKYGQALSRLTVKSAFSVVANLTAELLEKEFLSHE